MLNDIEMRAIVEKKLAVENKKYSKIGKEQIARMKKDNLVKRYLEAIHKQEISFIKEDDLRKAVETKYDLAYTYPSHHKFGERFIGVYETEHKALCYIIRDHEIVRIGRNSSRRIISEAKRINQEFNQLLINLQSTNNTKKLIEEFIGEEQ